MTETFEEYRRRVGGYIGNQDPIEILRDTPSRLDRLVSDCAPSRASHRPQPTKWSIVEILAHMCDAELAFGWRVRRVVAESGCALPWFDQEKWATQLGYADRSVRVELEQFRASRRGNLVVVESVPRAAWSTYYGDHAVRGRQTLADFIELEAGHDLNHIRQIQAILNQAWPVD